MRSSVCLLLFVILQVQVSLQCLDGWLSFQESCYLFVQEKYSWFDAKRSCDQANAVIAEVDNAEENAFLGNLLNPVNETWGWIGLEDMFEEGTWVLPSSQKPPMYFNWNTGEPNDYHGTEDCVVMSFLDGKTWIDVPCEAVHAVFFCEKSSA